MAMIRLTPFGGMVPKLGPRLLPNEAAQAALNVKLYSGELQPLRNPQFQYSPSAPKTNPAESILRARNGTNQAAWFTWPDDVDCVRAPLSTDVESRFYWTGDGEPRFAPYSTAISGSGDDYPHSYFALGIPAPTTAASVSVSGGSLSDVTRFYRYTFFSQHGEESAPSPVSAEVTGKIDGTWSIGATTAMQGFPASSGTGTAVHSGGYTTFTNGSSALHWLRVGDEVVIGGDTVAVSEITSTSAFKVPGDYSAETTWERKAPWNTTGMKRRLYRTTGSTGSWQLVHDDVSTSYSDTLTDAEIMGDDLISDGWDPPPAGLHSLRVHPSGSLMGIVGNLLCASEPHQPHAWPEAYRLASGFNGVGLAMFGTTAVMATAGMPFVATGTEPASMSGDDVQGMYPCLSKRSVISDGESVLYSSRHGLVQVGTSGVGVFTKPWYESEEWENLNPETMICEIASGRLYVAYTQDDGTGAMLVFDNGNVVGVSLDVNELYTDPATGNLYVTTAEGICLWDSSSEVPLQGNWRSKEFVLPAPINIGAGKIEYDQAIDPDTAAALTALIAAIAADNAAMLPSPVSDPLTVAMADALGGGYGDDDYNETAINGCALQVPPDEPPSNLVTVTLYSGSTVIASRLVSSDRAFRLPGGYKKDHFSVQVTSQCTVKEIRLAETMNELRTA